MRELKDYKLKIILSQLCLFVFVFFISCSKDIKVIDNDLDNDKDPIVVKDPYLLEKDFRIDKEGYFANIIVPQDEYDKFLTDNIVYTKYTNKVYKYFKDEFDFVVLVTPETTSPAGVSYAGIRIAVKNEVKGIGSVLFDNAAKYGSEGKLKSVLYMPKMSAISQGPILHEICHQWANHGFIETQVGGHWGYSSVDGSLGGFEKLEDLGNKKYKGTVSNKIKDKPFIVKDKPFGTFANGGNSAPYSIVELYLMGLANYNELPEVKVAINAKPVTGEFGSFTADEIKVITPSDLVKKHGERLPVYESSQKDFRMMVLVVSNRKLSEDETFDLNKKIKSFTRKGQPDNKYYTFNFWKATRERGTMVSNDLDKLLK